MAGIERGKFYRARDGVFLGVCKGIAEALDSLMSILPEVPSSK